MAQHADKGHGNGGRQRGRWRTGALAVTAAVLVAGAIAAGTARAQPPVTPTATSSAVWPYASGTVRYPTPEAAARGFATDFLGMHDPVVSEFRQGDTRSGEIDIGPAGGEPGTGLLVRQLTTDDSWWVLGAGTDSIDVVTPEAGALISSPVTVSGRSEAFEGTVPIEVRQDGSTRPIGSGFVTGGAGPDLGPFRGDITFAAPTVPSGALVFLVLDYERGGVAGATVRRVHFSTVPPSTTTTRTATSSTTVTTAPRVTAVPRFTG